MKHEKKLIIITAVLTLLPALIGILLWNRLPDQLPTHWNAAGEVDSYMAKPYAVFGISGFLLVVHLVCTFVTMYDPRNVNVPKKVNQLVLWICPAVGLYVSVLTYLTAMGTPVNATVTGCFFVGLVVLVTGYYLPKSRPNYTIGIKLPWTLADDENWEKTHRMAGPIWMVGGVLIILSGMLGKNAVYGVFPVLLIMITAPTVYSWMLYRKKTEKKK